MKFFKLAACATAISLAMPAYGQKRNLGPMAVAVPVGNVVSYLNDYGIFWDYTGNGENLDAANVTLTRKVDGKTAYEKKTIIAYDINRVMKEDPGEFKQLASSFLPGENLVVLERDSPEFRRIEGMYEKAKEQARENLQAYRK